MCKRKKKKPSLKIILLIIAYLFLFAVAITFLALSESVWIEVPHISILKVVSSSFASIFGIGAIWEIFGKKNMFREFSDELKKSQRMEDIGISDYYKSFKDDIEWDKELKNVTNLTALLMKGKRWTEKNEQLLKTIAAKGKLTIILPDYTKDDVVSDLILKFRKSSGKGCDVSPDEIKDMREQIMVRAGNFLEIGADLKFYNKIPSFSYYDYGETLIASPYFNESTDVNIDVPAFKLGKNVGKDSNFYKNCKADLNAIMEKATRPLNEEEDEEEKLKAAYADSNENTVKEI